MKNRITNIQNLRILSQVFSPSLFQKIVREDDHTYFVKNILKYFPDDSHKCNLDVIKSLYISLQKNYRCEYIYKNNIFIDIIKSYGLKDTLTINELKIGSSLADLVLLNGSIRVYEIKTELDDLSKLSKQLKDYQRFSDKVYIVTDEKYARKVMLEYADTNIGIAILTTKNKLEVVKEANCNFHLFEFDTIFKVLRKQEYLDLVRMNFGIVPKVPNTKIFKASYALLSKVELAAFQKQVLHKLKERKLSNPVLLKSPNTPKELKHICNSLDFNEQEYKKLYNFLAAKTYVPTIH